MIWRSPGVSILGQVVPGLAASLLTAEPFLLLLDDLHEVDDQACRDALTLLVDRLPPGSTVAAASRGEVWLNLARRRARGELLEIGPRELAFDVEEAGQLLTAAGVDLAPEAVADLCRRTEGWPAGLYLGALALRDGPGGPRRWRCSEAMTASSPTIFASRSWTMRHPTFGCF